MQELYDFLLAIQPFVFGLVGAVAVWQWLRTRSAPSAWMAATFVVLTLVVIGGRLLPEQGDASWLDWARKVRLAVTVLFPYFLYRFTVSMVAPVRWFRALGTALTVGAVASALALPELPGPGEPRPAAYQAFLYLVIVQWVFLSSRVAWRLFRAGSHQPAVIRHRMRTLAAGAVGLTIAVVAAGAGPPDGAIAYQAAIQMIVLLSAGLLLVGFAPPPLVRAMWRQEEVDRARRAQFALIQTNSPAEVAAAWLPSVSRLLGGGGAVLVEADGSIAGAHGVDAVEAHDLAQATATDAGEGMVTLASGGYAYVADAGNGWLVVKASPFAPFFGREEMEILRHLAVAGSLALTRSQLFERERSMRAQLDDAQAVARLGSWEWDVVDDTIAWSDELYRMFGVAQQEFDARYEGFLALVHPDDRDFVGKAVEKAYTDKEPFELEHRVLRPDGAVVWVHARGRPMVNRQGELIGMLGTSQDITERKRQEALREEQERSLAEHATLLDLARDAIFVRDENDVIVYWNQGAEALYGWPRQEALGRRSMDLLQSEAALTWDEVKARLAADGGWEGEISQRRKDGSRVVVMSRWALQRDALGRPLRVLEINSDITDQKRHEAFRDQFISNAAHELRTPLTTMLGFIDLLANRRDTLDEQRFDTVMTALVRAGDRLGILVNNLLDLSRLQQGRLAVEIKETDVSDVVRNVLEALPPPEDTEVQIRLEQGLKAFADPLRLDQIVSNLVTNAYRYGGSLVEVTTEAVDAIARICVADNGPGVGAALVSQLFEPFSRGPEAYAMGGSGLGLYIVKMLTEACGGGIGYRPNEPTGAVFVVELQRAE